MTNDDTADNPLYARPITVYVFADGPYGGNTHFGGPYRDGDVLTFGEHRYVVRGYNLVKWEGVVDA